MGFNAKVMVAMLDIPMLLFIGVRFHYRDTLHKASQCCLLLVGHGQLRDTLIWLSFSHKIYAEVI